MWQGYIPSSQVDTLASYIQTPGSPLYRQSGIPGQLAKEIDTSYPLAGGSGSMTASTISKKSNKRRDIIIGVCVGVGSLIWIALVYWVYRKVRRNHDKNIHRRLSEHMSTYGATANMTDRGGGGVAIRHSLVSSIAASEIDGRPSSFYANPEDNESSSRDRRRTQGTSGTFQSAYSDRLPTPDGGNVGSGHGSSWFRSSSNQSPPLGQSGSRSPRDMSQHPQNPFADILHRSYFDQAPPTSPGWRRSVQAPVRPPVNKGQISGPTLQANSLEFWEHQ